MYIKYTSTNDQRYKPKLLHDGDDVYDDKCLYLSLLP
jgi:hypothetical protein